jgi:hypothetical protein
MSHTTHRLVERIIIALMLAGIAGMFQPFSLNVYRYGFLTLLLSTILFIIISHVAPKPGSPDAAGPISLEHVAEHEQGHDQSRTG